MRAREKEREEKTAFLWRFEATLGFVSLSTSARQEISTVVKFRGRRATPRQPFAERPYAICMRNENKNEKRQEEEKQNENEKWKKREREKEGRGRGRGRRGRNRKKRKTGQFTRGPNYIRKGVFVS